MIEVRNLTKKYGDHLAVDDLSFTIDKGRVYGFLGPNGAGKSTTMNIITGYLAATGGTVVIDGADILKEPEKAKDSVGYLPEIPPVYTDMTVEEYLGFAAELKGIPKDERKLQADIMMRRVKLEDVAGRLIGNLSKGYRQRVGLAQAMIGFPETIILDEPMVGLDPQQIIEIRNLIRSLAKNHTVILSSHILAEVRELCDYIIMISGGRLVASDTPENLEKLFGGDRRIMLEARGSREQIEAVMKNVTGCSSFEITDVDSTGSPKDIFSVELIPDTETPSEGSSAEEAENAAEQTDIREEIFFAFADAGVPVLSMTEKRSTLEEVYLKLTQEGGASVESGI